MNIINLLAITQTVTSSKTTVTIINQQNFWYIIIPPIIVVAVTIILFIIKARKTSENEKNKKKDESIELLSKILESLKFNIPYVKTPNKKDINLINLDLWKNNSYLITLIDNNLYSTLNNCYNELEKFINRTKNPSLYDPPSNHTESMLNLINESISETEFIDIVL